MASNNVASEVNSTLATALAGGSEEVKNGVTTNVTTLAGESDGATTEVAVDVQDLVVVEAGGDEDEEEEEISVVSAHTSSNYQAVNNSVLVAGSCAVKDPGAHFVVVEHVDDIRDYDDDHHFEEGEAAN